jgi:hypothetical protein
LATAKRTYGKGDK